MSVAPAASHTRTSEGNGITGAPPPSPGAASTSRYPHPPGCSDPRTTGAPPRSGKPPRRPGARARVRRLRREARRPPGDPVPPCSRASAAACGRPAAISVRSHAMHAASGQSGQPARPSSAPSALTSAARAVATCKGTSESVRPARMRKTPSTWFECLASTTRWCPLGALLASNQFLTVRSFAPVSSATRFTAEPLPSYSDLSASATACANSAAHGPDPPAPPVDRKPRSFFGNDIQPLRCLFAESEPSPSGRVPVQGA